MDGSFLKEALKNGAALGSQAPKGVRPFWFVPDGYEVQTATDEELEAPFRLKQTVTVYDPKSFVDYFTDYCNEDSRIFADLQAPSIVGVIDYHLAGAGTEDGTEPRWTAHRLVYKFRHTTEWRTWTEKNRVGMKQIEFARFIEDNLPDITHPPHADMLQVSRTMEAKKNVSFSSGVRLQNGELQLQYQEEIRGTAAQGTLEIPEVFKLRIAPFEGSDLYVVDARFRYTIKENSLTLWYELVRPHKIVDDAVNKVVEAIRQGVTNPITFGVI
jgi:uncharacterized protein YfdQ (DUF2303 family)